MSAQMNRHRKATVAARAFERAAPRDPWSLHRCPIRSCRGQRSRHFL